MEFFEILFTTQSPGDQKLLDWKMLLSYLNIIWPAATWYGHIKSLYYKYFQRDYYQKEMINQNQQKATTFFAT